MGKSRKITDGALLIAVYIVLLLLVMFIPFVIFFGLFTLPIPFILYTARHDWKSGIMMFVATVIVSLIFATIVSLPLTLLAGIGGIVIGTSINRQVSAYDTWARGSVGFILSIVVVILSTQLIFDVNLMTEMDMMMQESMQFTIAFMEQVGLGGGNEEQLLQIEEQMKMFIDLLPSSIAIMGIIIAFVTQWLSYRIISRIERIDLSFPPYRKFNLPASIVWLYLLVLILSLFDVTQYTTVYLTVLNAMAILTVLIIIQGFSFVFFYTNYKNIHKSIPIIVIIISFILPFILLFFVRLLGIIDIGFGLKERMSKNED